MRKNKEIITKRSLINIMHVLALLLFVTHVIKYA